jgi:hypothetical protein
MGRGEFENVPGTLFYEYYGSSSTYKLGITPEIHFGRMLGERFQAGISYEGWMTEFGDVDVGLPAQWRRSLQNLSLSFAVFPGNQRGASWGIFLRAGAGLGWAGSGVKKVIEGEAQGEGFREDDWGWSTFGEGGYEFWIHPNATAGLSATINYMNVSGDNVVTNGWFTSLVINFNVYW